MRLVREDLTSRLEDLINEAIALEGRERQDLGEQEQHEADQGSGFHE